MKSKTHDHIIISKSRVNNLKNLSVSIPKKKLVVITGLSGSGKSSLAFDTLFAEGQRRYVESLSSYARQFLGRMDKPEVDSINGIAPAIAIEQKVNSRNPRSTVGITTEIYEYVKLLFARVGKTYSPVSGKQVARHTVKDIVDFITSLPDETSVIIYTPLLVNTGRELSQQLQILLQQGFNRVLKNGKIQRIEDILENNKEQDCKLTKKQSCFLVIDRIIVDHNDEDMSSRIADSSEIAFYEGNGDCFLTYESNGEKKEAHYSNRFEADGIKFEEPSVNMFAFNNPLGACKSCEGFGTIIGIDPDLVIPNPSLSVYEEAIACWKGEKMSEWKDQLIRNAEKFDFPIHRPYFELSDEHKELLWTGNKYFEGIDAFFKHVEEQTYKIQYRVMLSRYRGKTMCPDCKGTRLRKDTNYIKISGKNVSEIVRMQLDSAYNFFTNIKFDEYETKITRRILLEITTRLRFLLDVGLSYLTMNRLSSSLSGGESQRINLATSLGSSLVGSMYILDEPSIGLHPRDTERLIKVLYNLRDIGNSVIVVEHDDEIISASDHIIDIGPDAGEHGGELVFEGTFDELENENKSYTALYMTNRKRIEIPDQRRKWNNYLDIKNATQNNLKNISPRIPLNVLLVITGVSGSGKSTLVKDILYPSVKRHLDGYAEKAGRHGFVTGELDRISAVEYVNQNPIGRSSRSNPATYLKAFDDIRTLFSSQKLAKLRGFKPGYFSFNVPGGRCDQCEGEGVTKVEMQFMADIYLKCDSCNGTRFKNEVLDIKYNGLNISDILELTIDQALEFFNKVESKNATIRKIIEKIKPLSDVGLGYLRMGQSSNTLSGGEAQRVKLAFFLSKGNSDSPTLFVFDEPTTGLHVHDISKLLHSLNSLIEIGHSIIVIEHNTEVIKAADWIIDLGPEGGDEGGEIVFEGLPEDILKCKKSHTGKYLKEKFDV